jgi:hypothetical protein
MKRLTVDDLPVDQLVEEFAALGVEQDKAQQADDIAKVNRLFRRMVEIQKELKSRPGDQRRALMILYGYPNMQVRLQAAQATLAVAPQAARQMVETVASSKLAVAVLSRQYVPLGARQRNVCARVNRR